MLKYLFIFFLLTVTRGTAAADFVLAPATLTPGGVAMLCWQGTRPPPTLLQVSMDGFHFPRMMQDQTPCALVGVDLNKAPGLWPLQVESIDAAGIKHLSYLSLRIAGVERPAQKLTLPKEMVTPTKAKTVKKIAADRQRLDRIFSSNRPVLFSSPFQRPLSGEVISTFGLRRILNGLPRSPHNGIDFRAGRGTSVLAMARGQVVLADDLYYTGKTVILDHGGGLFSLYAHLETLSVAAGATIPRGIRVGTVGSTGRSTGPHLHMGARLGQARIDPLALIALFSDEKH